MRPLTDYVVQLRNERPDVPWFDPADGGIAARILLLFEAPGPRAVGSGVSLRGSGFVSSDNDDQTAANIFLLRDEAALSRDEVIHWNIVPWYVGDGTRIRGVLAADIIEALPHLQRLLDLLPWLKVVVTLGRKSERGWIRFARHSPQPLVHLSCPHPSPRNLNGRPASRDRILETLRQARSLITD